MKPLFFMNLLVGFFMFSACEKNPAERRSELEQETQQNISDARADASEEIADVQQETSEDIAELNREISEQKNERSQDINEISNEMSNEIAEIRLEAKEERREIYLDSMEKRVNDIEKRIDVVEDRVDDKKQITPSQAESLVKLSGAKSQLEKAKEIVNDTNASNWKELRPVVQEAYENLYSALDQAQNKFSTSQQKARM